MQSTGKGPESLNGGWGIVPCRMGQGAGNELENVRTRFRSGSFCPSSLQCILITS